MSHVDYASDQSVLVLEDLAGYGSQRHDTQLADAELSLALDGLAAFQAQWWGGRSLEEQRWLARLEHFDADACEAAVRRAARVFADVIGEGLSVGERFIRGQGGLYQRMDEAPRTFVHNDYRPDNLFFGHDGTVALIDFQASFCGSPAVDLAMLLVCGMSIEERRAQETHLIEEYARRLDDHGVAYPPDRISEDYPAGLLYLWPRALVAFSLLADKSRSELYAYQSEFVRRTVAAFQDHDCISILD